MAGKKRNTIARPRRARQPRPKRKDGASGLRIVIAATAITVAILFFAFGAVGMLMLARSPQEPVAAKLEPGPFVAPQLVEAKPEPRAPEPVFLPEIVPVPAPTQAQIEHEAEALELAEQTEPETADATGAEPVEPQAEPEALAAAKTGRPEADAETQAEAQSEADPETTAAVPSQATQAKKQPPRARKKAKRPRPNTQRQRAIRRPAQKKEESQNPLLQLFGAKQYR